MLTRITQPASGRPRTATLSAVAVLLSATATLTACSSAHSPGHDAAATPGASSETTVTTATTTKLSASTACAFLAEVNAAAQKTTTPASGLRTLAGFAAQFPDQLARSPAAMRGDMTVVFTASRNALAHHDLIYLVSDKVAAAGARLSDECRSTSS
jgi:hypothetical protein